ncbi:hypothetical protein LOZ51_002428 [Ophidiomyces ophidiicola]|nr:hypothetical protein LOZ55_000614 [Ophidiomyces ophidiicola]KAI1984249.1 hypothetical protein LOZ54_004625 [Ophidiomyces ophidiicola]KAI1998694.1 hypothetical protein LOZ51_002428 [Ophidiomyces ophidiicola]
MIFSSILPVALLAAPFVAADPFPKENGGCTKAVDCRGQNMKATLEICLASQQYQNMLYAAVRSVQVQSTEGNRWLSGGETGPYEFVVRVQFNGRTLEKEGTEDKAAFAGMLGAVELQSGLQNIDAKVSTTIGGKFGMECALKTQDFPGVG